MQIFLIEYGQTLTKTVKENKWLRKLPQTVENDVLPQSSKYIFEFVEKLKGIQTTRFEKIF